MKKSILFMAFAVAVAFSSCSKDDDEKNCESCELEGVPIKACDNGDGTVSISSEGEETVTISEEELGGLTPESYLQVIKLACTAN